MLAGASDPDDQREIGLGPHSGGKEDSVWNTGDLLGYLLVSLHSVIKTNGKQHLSGPGGTPGGPDPSGVKA